MNFRPQLWAGFYNQWVFNTGVIERMLNAKVNNEVTCGNLLKLREATKSGSYFYAL